MDVLVDRVEMEPGSTIALGFGTDVETGDPVMFGGDWRPMRDLAEALEAGDRPIEAWVEPWQIL